MSDTRSPGGDQKTPFAAIEWLKPMREGITSQLPRRESGFSGDARLSERQRTAHQTPVFTHSPARCLRLGLCLVHRQLLVFHGVWFPEGGHYTAAPRTCPVRGLAGLADRGVAPRLFNRHFAGTSTANCDDSVADYLAVVNSIVL